DYYCHSYDVSLSTVLF
nr:immunoglobulin light chain junction region [Macaca mulatta]MOW01156.1 immunoglobulin light chain junction region [Macaca mulatta]MOW01404.1 immunoglobulin light chain junction region [Macaca mulatta]